MKTTNRFFTATVIVLSVFMSGCGLVPDKVSAKLSSMIAPPPGYIPRDRIDVFNNIEGSVMTLHDRGGNIAGRIPVGGYGWVPQNTFFANDGTNRTDDNVITARFYDATTGEYLGLFHWWVGANGYSYQAFHSPFERKQLEH